MTDDILESKIEALKSKISNWARKNGITKEYGFTSHLDHFDDEPSEYPIVLVMWVDGYACDAINYELQDEFLELTDSFKDFHMEFWDHVTIVFYAIEENLNRVYRDYFEWKWICELIKPNYSSLYDEIFSHFSKNPDKLYNLEPRKFEILLHEVFVNQGYKTELGKGVNDGGIDLKIYQKDNIDQIVTLVQAKRYKKENPIKIESVQAFHTVVNEEKANRGLFVTTSRYLPGVHKFANRQRNRLVLADSQDVSKWCETVSTRIVRDKSAAISDDHIRKLLKKKNISYSSSLEGIIVRADKYNFNDFCLVVKDSVYASLLLRLPKFKVNIANHRQSGTEAPILDERALLNKNEENVFRAKKSVSDDGKISLWGQQKLYTIWDGEPKSWVVY